MRHRNYVYLLVLLVPAVALIGGWLNDATASGRVTDESTGDPVAGAQVIYGIRIVLTDADGRYVLEHLPRGSRYSIQSRGYDPGTGDASRRVPHPRGPGLPAAPDAVTHTRTVRQSGARCEPIADGNAVAHGGAVMDKRQHVPKVVSPSTRTGQVKVSASRRAFLASLR